MHNQNINVLVTGASGFVGARLTEKLLDNGYTVHALIRDANKLGKAIPADYLRRLTVLEGDLLVKADLDKLKHELREKVGSLHSVVDLAGGGPLTANQRVQSFDRNYQTTSNLIQILQASEKLGSLSLLVYFSSVAAMGLPEANGDRILYTDTTACNPVLPLERGKFESESFLKELSTKHKLKIVVLRFPQIYGLADAAFMQMVSLIRKGMFPVVRGRIGSLPLINIRDVVNASYAVIENADHIQEKYGVHLISEGSYSYDQLVELVRKKYGSGGMLKLPYWLMYLGTSMAERLFGLIGKPEPLNRRRLVSLTKNRVVDSSKFVNEFNFKFEEDVESFICQLS